MTFKNYVCWKPESLSRVLDTEALEVSDDVFLATHYPIKLHRQDLLQENAPRALYQEDAFLRDFLSPPSFALVPVLGEAGTGKSHLIRWLAAHLRDEPGRRVVLIPRSRTNLRSVIGLILGDLPGKRLDEFRTRLQQETGQLTPERAAEILLDKLALEVGPNGLHELRDLDELQGILVELLPPLFRDPLFRKNFLRPGAIIERLCEHIVGLGGKIERLTERRAFSLEDLPLNVANSTRASQDAQACYSQLQNNPDLRNAAVGWINANLDSAIASLLQLRGETLSELMLEVREALFEAKTELILLIEDFAKLQGIDRQLLDALTVKSNQIGGRPLCTLRTAFGCTTGYFKGFAETFLQRFNFVVYMDAQDSDAEALADADLDGFVARYLNAIRLGDAEITDWYRAADDGGRRSELPNACVAHECEHQSTCHAAFGNTSEIGLYPFTPISLRRMLRFASPRGFNPRLLINKVLKHTLEMYGSDLEHGRFPPAGLQKHFGGTIDPMLRKRIDDNDPDNGDRRLALMDLWTNGRELVDLDARIHVAFDLPPLNEPSGLVRPTPVPTATLEKPKSEATTKQALPPALEAQLRAIDDWSSERAKLQFDITNALRAVLRDAIANHIDWDCALLVRGEFVGPKGFDGTSINFLNQASTKSARGYVLSIPDDPKQLSDAALALKGLLLFRHHRNWKFPDGAKYFRIYAQHLDIWGERILEFAKTTRANTVAWNPVPAAIELLALDARVSGRISGAKAGLADHLHALFASPTSVTGEARAKPWVELQMVLREVRPKLQRLILGRAACTKGGSSKVQVVDATQFIDPIQGLRRTWTLSADVPGDLREEYKFIAKVREKVDELLGVAIAAERARHVEWLAGVLSELGEDSKRDDIIEAVESASARAQAEGVHSGKPTELAVAVDRMRTLRLDQLVTAVKRIRGTDDRSDLIVDLSIDRSETMEAVQRFIAMARSFLDTSRKRLENDILSLESKGGVAVEQSCDAITQALAGVAELVGALGLAS